MCGFSLFAVDFRAPWFRLMRGQNACMPTTQLTRDQVITMLDGLIDKDVNPNHGNERGEHESCSLDNRSSI